MTQDLKRTTEKRTKIEADIQTQQALIRNTEALVALQRAEKIEQDLHIIAAKYVSVCDDVRNVFKNNPKIKVQPNIKRVYDELPKDPFQFLATEYEEIKDAFEDAITILEEEKPGNVKNLITRLSSLSRDATQQGRKVATMLPDSRALKRDIVKDIAALQVYDKQQFLMRAQTEQESIQTKIEFLNNELDPNKLAAMQQELSALARELGAEIKGDSANSIINSTTTSETEKNNSKDIPVNEEAKIEIVDLTEKNTKSASTHEEKNNIEEDKTKKSPEKNEDNKKEE